MDERFTSDQYKQARLEAKQLISTLPSKYLPDPMLTEDEMTEGQLWDKWEEAARQGILTPEESRRYMDAKTLMDPRSQYLMAKHSIYGRSKPITPEVYKKLLEAMAKDRDSVNDEIDR